MKSKLIIYSIFTLIVIILFASCRGEAIVFEGSEIIHLTEDLIIKEGDTLIINAGTEVKLDTGVNIIAYGSVLIKGTASKPVILKGSDAEFGWGKLWAKGECKELIIKHAIIENGQVMSYDTKNHFNHVHFKNNKQLKWDDAIARFWHGSVLIENCRIDGINKGEGFLLHNVEKPVIRKSVFTKIPDAVEYISCTDGKILENLFLFMKDDAIDQNACKRTLIKDNKILYTKDCGMEIGSENFGSSLDIEIYNNLIVGCPKGVMVKESSTVTAQNITFYNNDISVEARTPKDSMNGSQLVVTASAFFSNKSDFFVDNKSLLDFNHCISDSLLLEGKANETSKMSFEDLEKHQYDLIFEDFPEVSEKRKKGFVPIWIGKFENF